MKTDTTKTAFDLIKSSYINYKKISFYAGVLAIPTLLLVVSISFWLSNKLEKAGDWVTHTNEVQASLAKVLFALGEAETGQRGYLLTGNKSYLAPHTQSTARLKNVLSRLQALTVDNIEQQQRLKEINPLIHKKLNELEETIALVKDQRNQEALDIVIRGKGKKLMEQIAAIIDDMIKEESALLVVRIQTLDTFKFVILVTQVIGFLILILIGALTFLKVRGLVLQQIKLDEELVIVNEELVFQNAEKDKQANELMLAASVFTHALEGIIITDNLTNIIDINKAFTEISGYSREEVIGQSTRFLYADIHPPKFYAAMWQIINDTDQWIGEVWARRKNGNEYVAYVTISAVRNAVGEATHYVALFSDITQQRNHQSQLEQMAHYDSLTKLPNRALLADRLNQSMLQCRRNQKSLAVAFMDLDGFKYVNDTYGHTVGDELLIIVSALMKGALREVDTLARIGGDEFVAILPNLATNEAYKKTLERLLRAVSEPISVGDLILKISVSIGVTLSPQDDAQADILIRHADQAMYLAKQAGKNCYRLFDSAHDDAVSSKQETIEQIRKAYNNSEFILHYQPKVNMSTGEVVGVEALIRWQHPERGLVSPLDFLPSIENHIISLDIGEWVIDTALSQINQWQRMGIALPISVNISAHQLQQANFVERLAILLAAHPDVSAHLLELEILETSAFNDIDYIITTMQACIELGVNFALDDFGTGYSSLTYLKRLPASLIKIDQSFVRHMLTDADDLAIVRGVISLAKAFSLEVIAEGVETNEHSIALLQLGCELAQGYGIAKPMLASEFPAWLGNWRPVLD